MDSSTLDSLQGPTDRSLLLWPSYHVVEDVDVEMVDAFPSQLGSTRAFEAHDPEMDVSEGSFTFVPLPNNPSSSSLESRKANNLGSLGRTSFLFFDGKFQEPKFTLGPSIQSARNPIPCFGHSSQRAMIGRSPRPTLGTPATLTNPRMRHDQAWKTTIGRRRGLRIANEVREAKNNELIGLDEGGDSRRKRICAPNTMQSAVLSTERPLQCVIL